MSLKAAHEYVACGHFRHFSAVACEGETNRMGCEKLRETLESPADHFAVWRTCGCWHDWELHVYRPLPKVRIESLIF